MNKRARVLIIDDDAGLLQALSEMLQLRLPELTVDTSESATAALKQMKKSEFDAIVADIKMPGMDGLQLLNRIRDVHPDVPTLLITGHGEHELAVQALRGGAYDYVQKPIDREYFVGSLMHAIQRHQLSRTVADHKQQLEQHSKELEECLEERTHEVRELYQREAIARAELEKTTSELELARQKRLDLVSVIAHELATPLTTLRGYAELLTRPKVDEAARERARNIVVSETSRMERLLQDLVDGADEPDTGVSLELERCDLAALVREQVDVAGARSRKHTIVLEAPGHLAARIDRTRVAQVIANILANGIKYTPGGEIRVVLRRQSNTARLSIRDQGDGIPADSLNRIFEPRIRLNANAGATRRSPNSAGLGLSIARDIVEAHGGRIWADSPPGQGASFTVVLPLDAANASGGDDAVGVVEKLVTKPAPRPKARARRGGR